VKKHLEDLFKANETYATVASTVVPATAPTVAKVDAPIVAKAAAPTVAIPAVALAVDPSHVSVDNVVIRELYL
jgi:hypothetical protein